MDQNLTAADLADRIGRGIEDAQVEAFDTRGDGAHWRLVVVSKKFEGLGRLERHRLVLAQLEDSIGEGKPIHAVEIKPLTPGELAS